MPLNSDLWQVVITLYLFCLSLSWLATSASIVIPNNKKHRFIKLLLGVSLSLLLIYYSIYSAMKLDLILSPWFGGILTMLATSESHKEHKPLRYYLAGCALTMFLFGLIPMYEIYK